MPVLWFDMMRLGWYKTGFFLCFGLILFWIAVCLSTVLLICCLFGCLLSCLLRLFRLGWCVFALDCLNFSCDLPVVVVLVLRLLRLFGVLIVLFAWIFVVVWVLLLILNFAVWIVCLYLLVGLLFMFRVLIVLVVCGVALVWWFVWVVLLCLD